MSERFYVYITQQDAPHKDKIGMKCLKEPRNWTDSLDKQPKLGKIWHIWNIKSLYGASSLKTGAKGLSKYMLKYKRSDGTNVAPNQQVNICFSLERGMRIMN
jgi:hypothetical protein